MEIDHSSGLISQVVSQTCQRCGLKNRYHCIKYIIKFSHITLFTKINFGMILIF